MSDSGTNTSAGPVNNHNEKRENQRLEYEQIIATLHNSDIYTLGFLFFIIPLISWGLTLKPCNQTIFNEQDIVNIGRFSIAIYVFSVITSVALWFFKIKKLLERAKNIWKELTKNDENNTEKQPTHIDILNSRNPLDYSILCLLIGFAVCYLWIHKYPEMLSLF